MREVIYWILTSLEMLGIAVVFIIFVVLHQDLMRRKKKLEQLLGKN